MATPQVTMGPQPGPQTQFVTSRADIAVFGGAAGGGKSYSLILNDLYWIGNPAYRSVIFRRTFPQIRNPGGLWDTASMIYPYVGGKPNESRLEWRFPHPQNPKQGGALIKFSHLQYEADKLQHQGLEYARIAFDELDHFSETTFFYMLSRNRSTSGVRPYMRGTCNANGESWVAKLIEWWIDWDTGFPIPERAGQIRWFVRDDDGELRFASNPAHLPWVTVEVDGVEAPQPPKSLTFIPAKVTDNQQLLSKDPGYLASLLALPPLERGRLLDGNWKIKAAAGLFFKRDWFPVLEMAPVSVRKARYWDFAATEVKAGKDPDYTVGALVSVTPDGTYVIEDLKRIRAAPGDVEALVKSTAQTDGRMVPIYLEQEPGASGKMVIDHYVRSVLPGWYVMGVKNTGPKAERIKPLSSQAQVRNLTMVRGDWNGAFLDEAEGFPDGLHDDQLDAVAGAFGAIMGPVAGGSRAFAGPQRQIRQYIPQ